MNKSLPNKINFNMEYPLPKLRSCRHKLFHGLAFFFYYYYYYTVLVCQKDEGWMEMKRETDGGCHRFLSV